MNDSFSYYKELLRKELLLTEKGKVGIKVTPDDNNGKIVWFCHVGCGSGFARAYDLKWGAGCRAISQLITECGRCRKCGQFVSTKNIDLLKEQVQFWKRLVEE